MAGGGSGALRFRAMMMKAASPLMVKPRARPMRFATQARMLTAWRRTVAEFLQTGCPFFAGLGGGVDLGRRLGVWGLQRALRHPCGAPSPQPPPPDHEGRGRISFLPHVSQPLLNPPPRKARESAGEGIRTAVWWRSSRLPPSRPAWPRPRRRPRGLGRRRCRSRNRCRPARGVGSPTTRATCSMRSATTSGCSTKLVSGSITPATMTWSSSSGRSFRQRYSWAWRGLANGSTQPPTFAWLIAGRISGRATSQSCGPS